MVRVVFAALIHSLEIYMNNLMLSPEFAEAGLDVSLSPAKIVVNGKTSTDKKLSVLPGASFAAQAYLSQSKGKVGKAAREGVALNGLAAIAHAARRGNYKPLAEALAATLGESVFITSRATFQALPDMLSAKLQDLRNGGYSAKSGKPTGARTALQTSLALVQAVTEAADKMEV